MIKKNLKSAATGSFLFLTLLTFGQETSFGDDPVIWATNKAPSISAEVASLKADLVILEEKTEFYFYAKNNEKIARSVVVKINTAAGLQRFQSYKLPESFDNAYDANYYKQGRNARIKTPFIDEYRVLNFSSRKFSKNRWMPLTFNLKYETLKWIKKSGEFVNDQLYNFELQNISVGDVVEIYYESEFVSNYGSNLFYLNGPYPKLQCEYDFIYRVNKDVSNLSFLLPINIKDSMVNKSQVTDKDYMLKTDKIILKNLAGVNYPANSNPGKALPHVFIDFTFYRVISASYPTGSNRIYEYQMVRPKNFEWLVQTDTGNHYTKIYDKHSAALRKFISTLPRLGNDSANLIFFKALCDTLNSFRYISPNQLFYNESNLYDVSSSEQLLKRRLKGNMVSTIYRDILFENKIFHYLVNVQDRRYGEHSTYYRAHYAYEQKLVAIPYKNTFIYFMPRKDGIKYHLNELPFYYEGILGALQPQNFQENTKNKEGQFFKFIKTHRGTFNENTRTENATVKISLDSSKADFTIKESLSGQFSTVLRHLYLNEYIDSTISPNYFKRCTDKPYSSGSQIKLSSKITDFPFRYTFNCSEKVTLKSKTSIDLKNWFSFTLSGNTLPEAPSHDYFFDFDFSDSYNFLLDFRSRVEIKNSAEFTKNINNDYFELQSEIVKNTDSNYLLKVKVAVKEIKVPFNERTLLMNFVSSLDELNNFSMIIEKK